MTLTELLAKFTTLSFPVRFDHVEDGTRIPFGVLTFSQNNFAADNMVYIEMSQFDLRVYLDKLDGLIMSEVKDFLNTNELPYELQITYIDDAKAYELDYTFGAITED